MFVQNDVKMRSQKSDSETVYPLAFWAVERWKYLKLILRNLKCVLMPWRRRECSLPRTKFHEIHEKFEISLATFTWISRQKFNLTSRLCDLWLFTLLSPRLKCNQAWIFTAINLCVSRKTWLSREQSTGNARKVESSVDENRRLTLRKIVLEMNCDGRETFFSFCCLKDRHYHWKVATFCGSARRLKLLLWNVNWISIIPAWTSRVSWPSATHSCCFVLLLHFSAAPHS